MKRDPWVLIVIAAIVAAMLYGGIYAARKNRATGSVSSKLRGQTAPDFELKSLDGKNVKLSDFRGKAVLLNFWATWCGPCKIEMPWFVELQKEYGPEGFEVVGVAMDDPADEEEIAKFAKDLGVNYTVLVGTDAVGDSYNVNVFPTTFFIDRDGKLVAREFGLQSRSVFVDHIKESLGQPVQAQK
ncbi:MAG TPA: TlpA disulfide reductase family protein [Terriglobales bacterium]|nr:TlpA disulfide reductase family protein [Terriglobales bacterium]